MNVRMGIVESPPPDTGCHLAPRCLACPLPECHFEEPGWMAQEERRERNADILHDLRFMGREQVMARYGISERTLARIRQAARP